jgi:RNA polymerase sigma-70 factor (ECF subfamily)
MIATQHTLITRLCEEASNADWDKFYLLYQSPILAYAAAHSLDEAERRDVLQETMVKMLRGGFARFDPAKGRFTGFLFHVAKGCVIDALRRRSRRESRQISLESLSSELERQLQGPNGSMSPTPSELAERQGQIMLVARTMQFLIDRRCFQPRTVAIFKAVAIDAAEPREVARRFKTSVGNVYEAKRAVLAKLRKTLQALERGMGLDEAVAL